MDHRIDVLGPRCILFSWLCAFTCFPAALLIAALSQGIGAMIGGCSWIGISVPLNRQVWALVNQPAINFADTSAAHGYWLGSIIGPVIVIVILMFAIRRTPSLAYEMFSVQLTWALITMCLIWLIVIDPAESHFGMWLHFHDASVYFSWIVPLFAVMFGIVPTLRLLSVLRLWRRGAPGLVRMTTLIVHFGLPTAAWVVLMMTLEQEANIPAIAVLTLTLVVALVFVWFRYPAQPYRPFEAIRLSRVLMLMLGAGLLASVLWFAGRPLEDHSSSGVLWSQPSTTNNIRPWITAKLLFDRAREQRAE